AVSCRLSAIRLVTSYQLTALSFACGILQKIISNRDKSCDEKLSEQTGRPYFGHKAEIWCK
ncbi:MAG TPA: hypothetical protein VGK46_00825, partial [Saprospiraceae bacterium]